MEAKVTLGGVEYTIEDLPSRLNKPWKAQMRDDIKPLIQRMLGIRSMSFESTEDLDNILSGVVMPFLTEVDDALEQLLELVITYSPVLQADRARIEETVRDSEIAKAFVAVLGLAYPLGELMKLAQSLAG